MRRSTALRMAAGKRGGGWTPNPSILGWWYGSETVGGAWADRIGSAHATLVGNANLSTRGLAIPNHDGYAYTDGVSLAPLTVCAWLIMLDWRKFDTAIGQTESGLYWAIDIRAAYYWTMSGTGLIDVTPGVWHHVAFTLGSGILKWYSNGAYTGQSVYAGLLPDMGRFGSLNAAYPRYLSGELDDIQCYSSVLSDSAIADLYTNSPGSHA